MANQRVIPGFAPHVLLENATRQAVAPGSGVVNTRLSDSTPVDPPEPEITALQRVLVTSAYGPAVVSQRVTSQAVLLATVVNHLGSAGSEPEPDPIAPNSRMLLLGVGRRA